jgi:hypothetical protein
MSPVDIPPIDTVLAPLASSVNAPVPLMAVPDTLRLLTALAVSEPPDTEPPDNVPPEMVAPLMVELALRTPAAVTENSLVPLLRKSIRLPVAATLLLLANISALPAVGLED